MLRCDIYELTQTELKVRRISDLAQSEVWFDPRRSHSEKDPIISEMEETTKKAMAVIEHAIDLVVDGESRHQDVKRVHMRLETFQDVKKLADYYLPEYDN